MRVNGCQTMRNRVAFTLVEAMVAVILCAVGVVGSMQAMASLQKTNIVAVHREKLLTLAFNKLQEIGISGPISEEPTSGDFGDDGDAGISYSMELTPGTVTNTFVVSITVTDSLTDATLSTVVFDKTATASGPTAEGATP